MRISDNVFGRLNRRVPTRVICAATIAGESRMGVIGRIVGAAVIAVSALSGNAVSGAGASAAPCPDVEVVFARGTFEPAGVGGIGQAFVDALTSRLAGKSVDVYPVNYPASLDFA